jgi:ketosteroid isomerase-like protein
VAPGGKGEVFRSAGISYLRIPAEDPHPTAAFYEGVFGWSVDKNRPDPSFEDGTGHVIGHIVPISLSPARPAFAPTSMSIASTGRSSRSPPTAAQWSPSRTTRETSRWRRSATRPATSSASGRVDQSAEQSLRSTYRAFNDRDLEAALALMHPEVDWPNAWEGGRVVGRAAVREYWTRQFAEISSKVTPEGFNEEADGSITVDVHQVVHDARSGELISDSRVRHRYRFEDGLVARMDVVEPD